MGATISTVEGEKPRTKEQIARTKKFFTDLEMKLQNKQITKAEAKDAVRKRAAKATAEWRSLANACTDATVLDQYPQLCEVLGGADASSVYAVGQDTTDSASFSDKSTGCEKSASINRSLATSAAKTAQEAKQAADEAKARAAALEKSAKEEKKNLADALKAKQAAADEARQAADDAQCEAKAKEAEAKKEAAAAKKEEAKIAAAVKQAEQECFENSCGERSESAKASLARLMEQQKAAKAEIATAQKALRAAEKEARLRAAEIKKAEEDCAKVEARKEAERARVAAERAAEAKKAADEATKEAKAAEAAAAAAKAKCTEKNARVTRMEALVAKRRKELQDAEDAVAKVAACADDCTEVERLQALADAKKQTAAQLRAEAKPAAAAQKAKKTAVGRKAAKKQTAAPAKESAPKKKPLSPLPVGAAVGAAAVAAMPSAVTLTPGEVQVAEQVLQKPLVGDLRAAFRRMRYLQGAPQTKQVLLELRQMKEKYPVLAQALTKTDDYRAYLQAYIIAAATGADLKQVTAMYESKFEGLALTDAEEILQDEKRCVSIANASADTCATDSCDYDANSKLCYDRDFQAPHSDGGVSSTINIAGVDADAVTRFRRDRLLADLVNSARATDAQMSQYLALPAINKSLLTLAAESKYDEARRMQYYAKRAAGFNKESDDYVKFAKEGIPEKLSEWRRLLRQTALGLHLVKLFDAETSLYSETEKCLAISNASDESCSAQGCDFYEGGSFTQPSCYDNELQDYNKLQWYIRDVSSTPLSHARTGAYQETVLTETKLWRSLESGTGQSENARFLIEKLGRMLENVPTDVMETLRTEKLQYFDMKTQKPTFMLKSYDTFAQLYDAIWESAKQNPKEKNLAEFMSRRIAQYLSSPEILTRFARFA